MPYYVYKIFNTPIRRLEMLESHDSFRESSNRVKQMRSELGRDVTYTIKVIFAESELQAEDLLYQVREAIPNPQDD